MMNRQMDMFREGGLNQEGGMIDAESGNEVPVGSTREEVRDDIPAKLSEGEFVMPADVVRYHGLDKMMALRDEAKMGLQKMNAMGQMGNSEEATLPEEMPFGMADLMIVAEDGREVEMAEGGYVSMANGGDPSSNVRQLGPTYTPTVSQPINFSDVMGEAKLSYKEYRNAQGNNILVAFIGGKPLYPIPEGYTEYTAGADEPVTPIQEFVQESPPTPQPNEERDGPNYIDGYSLDMATASTAQLENELRKQTSGIGKLASGIAFALGGPLVAGVFETGKSASANKLAVEIQRRLDTGLIPPDRVQALTAQLAEMKKNVGFGLAPNLLELGRKAADILGIDLTKDNAITKVLSFLKDDPSGETAQKVHNDLKTSALPMRPTGVDITGGIQPESQAIPPRSITGGIQPESQAGITPAISDTSAALRSGFDTNRTLRERGRLIPGINTSGLNANYSTEMGIFPTIKGLEDLNYNQYSKGIPTPPTPLSYDGGNRISEPLPVGKIPDSRGPNQIPDSTTPFPAVNRQLVGTQPVGTKMLDNVGGTSGRQNVIKQDMFPPMTYNTEPYDERNESVYGTDVTVNPATNFVQNERMMYNRPADTKNYSVNTSKEPFLQFPSEMESILQSGVQTPVPALQAGASDFNQDGLRSLTGTNDFVGTGTPRFPNVSSIMPSAGSGTDPDALDPRGRSQIPEFKINPDALDPRGRSQIPEFKINPDSGMGGAIQSRQSPVPISAPSVLPSTSFAPEFSTGMGGAIQDQQRRRESTLGQMTTPQYQPSVAAKTATAASIYDKSFGAGAQIITGIPLVEDQVYDVSDSTQRAAANKALNIATSPGTAGTGPRAHILSSGRKVPINSAIAQNDREIVASGYTGTDAEQNVTGKISGVNGLSGVVKSGVGNKAAKVAGKTVYKDSSGKAYTNSTFGSKVEVQLVNGKWSNKTSAKGKPVKYSKGTGVSSGHGTQNEQDNSSDKEESKIICTAMNASYGFGSYRQAVWLNYSNKHLTKEHEVGYHTLFLPLVHLAYTKDNKLIRKLLEHGTRRRTADIRAELKGTKRNTLGRIYRAVLEPLCYGVGKIKMTLGE